MGVRSGIITSSNGAQIVIKGVTLRAVAETRETIYYMMDVSRCWLANVGILPCMIGYSKDYPKCYIRCKNRHYYLFPTMLKIHLKAMIEIIETTDCIKCL